MSYPVFGDINEKPLEKLIDDGGFAVIFRRIAAIGDSLSSGEFQIKGDDDKWRYIDKFEYSWGQFLARTTGAKVFNFSCGGMTAQNYYESFAPYNDFFRIGSQCQAHIIALGANDLPSERFKVGDMRNIDPVNEENNDDTFAGYMAKIIVRIRKLQKDPFIFLVTMPRGGDPAGDNGFRKAHAELMRDMAELFPNTYVIDLNRYAPVYDEAFKSVYYLNGHMNPCGYALTAKMIVSYIDWLIRRDVKKFELVGLMDEKPVLPEQF